MDSIEKEFVPYDPALRLKALGFKERVLTYYEDGKPKLHTAIEGWDFNSSFLNCVSRPTYSQAFRWLTYQIDDEYRICLGEEGWYVYNLENNIIYENAKALEKLIEIVESKTE